MIAQPARIELGEMLTPGTLHSPWGKSCLSPGKHGSFEGCRGVSLGTWPCMGLQEDTVTGRGLVPAWIRDPKTRGRSGQE